MECLVGSGDDLALIGIVSHGISVKSDIQVRIDRENVSLDPCALAADHGGFAVAERSFFTGKIGLEGLVIAVGDHQVDEIKEVVVKFRIIGDFCFTFFEFRDQLSGGDTGAFSCCIHEVLCYMFEHPPLCKTGREGLVSGFGDLRAGIDQFFGGLRERFDSGFGKNVLVVDNTEVVAFDGKAVASGAVRRRLHGSRNTRIHGIDHRLACQVIGIFFISIDLFSGGR